MTESLEILRSWFKESVERCGSLDTVEIDYTNIADFMVFKGLFTEKETGTKFILKFLEIKPPENNESVKISYNQFQRMFCRTLFKVSLI